MSTLVPRVDAGPFIGGRSVDSFGSERHESISPATGETVGSFALGTAEDVDRAVAAASEAFESWSALSVFERCAYLERVIVEIGRRREELGRLLALEQGKPYHLEALPEVDESANNFRVAIEIAKHLDGGSIIPLANANRRAFAYRVPRGVVAAVQPWR